MLDKPDVVYVVEGQPASVTVTFNHVEAQIVWRRLGPALHAPLPIGGSPVLFCPSWPDLPVASWVTSTSLLP